MHIENVNLKEYAETQRIVLNNKIKSQIKRAMMSSISGCSKQVKIEFRNTITKEMFYEQLKEIAIEENIAIENWYYENVVFENILFTFIFDVNKEYSIKKQGKNKKTQFLMFAIFLMLVIFLLTNLINKGV